MFLKNICSFKSKKTYTQKKFRYFLVLIHKINKFVIKIHLTIKLFIIKLPSNLFRLINTPTNICPDDQKIPKYTKTKEYENYKKKFIEN